MDYPTAPTAAVASPAPCILKEAETLITKDRRSQYGPVKEDFGNAAKVWTVILSKILIPGEAVSASQIAQCMVALKLVRECYKPKRDNRTDIIGYTALLDTLEQQVTATVTTVAVAPTPASEVPPPSTKHTCPNCGGSLKGHCCDHCDSL